MTWRNPLFRGRRRRAKEEKGYFSILTIIMFVTLFGLAAFAVDVGNWYLTGQHAQRAADAAALAGVPNLPGNKTTAFSTAQTFAKNNGFQNGVNTVMVVPCNRRHPDPPARHSLQDRRQRVRRAVRHPQDDHHPDRGCGLRRPGADGQPCNTFGNDPDPSTFRGSTCGLVNGQLWANINSPSSAKTNGDAYQSASCSTEDMCTAAPTPNTRPTATSTRSICASRCQNLVIQAFDPAWVNVGLTCTDATTSHQRLAAQLDPGTPKRWSPTQASATRPAHRAPTAPVTTLYAGQRNDVDPVHCARPQRDRPGTRRRSRCTPAARRRSPATTGRSSTR